MHGSAKNKKVYTLSTISVYYALSVVASEQV